MVKIFVGNIAEGVSSEELQKQFENYGTVKECAVLGSFGFVHMPEDEEAEIAIKHMDKHKVNGQELNVEKSKSSGSGGKGSSFRGGRGGGPGRSSGNGYGYGGGGGMGMGFSDNSQGAKSARRAGCSKLHIANLCDGMQPKELRMMFERYGRVAECDIVEDRKIAFVHIETEAADAAIRGLNGREVRGMPLKVQLSKNQNSNGSSGGSGDGYRSQSMRGMGHGMRGGFPDRMRGRGLSGGGFMGGGFRGRGRGGFGGDGFHGGHDRYSDDLGGYGDYGDEGGLGDAAASLPPPAKDRMELLELLDRRRRLEALDPYERRLIACPDPFSLPPPPPEYLRLLRERAMVKARLPLPPSTGSLATARASQAQQATGASASSLTRALIARRAAAVAACARAKIRSAGESYDPYGEADSSHAAADDYMYGAMGGDY